jgi:hypothetical protein
MHRYVLLCDLFTRYVAAIVASPEALQALF